MGNGRSMFAARHLRWLFERGTAVGLTDAQLLERVVDGLPDREAAEAAFQVLVERHGPMVLRVCRCALGDAHDAEDAFQATFLTLAAKARTVWVKDSLGPWLHAVALRVTAKAKTNMARRKVRERKAAEMAAAHQDDGVRTEADLAAVLHEEVGRLPQKYRAPIVLCYLEGLTHEAAAQQLAWPVGTVRGRLARGRGLLRSRLERRGMTEPAAVLASAVAIEGQARAAVPAALLKSTTRAAVRVVAGAEASAVASGTVVALMRGAGVAVLGPKLKTGVAAGIALLAVGSVLLAGRASVPPPETSPILRGHTVSVTSVAFAPDGTNLASAGFDGTVKLWDVSRRRERLSLPAGSGIVTAVAFDPSGGMLASAGHSPVITLWDTRAGRQVGTIASGHRKSSFTGISEGVNALAFSPDGRWLAWALGPDGDGSRFVRVWDRHAGREIDVPSLHGHAVVCLAFSPDGRTLASGDCNGTVKVWDVADGRVRLTLMGGCGPFSSLAFSPDGETLACAGSYPEIAIRLWALSNGRKVGDFRGHRVPVGSIAFSPDGGMLASGDHRGTIKLWHVLRGRAVTTPKAHSSAIASLAFSPDGRTLATGSWDETVRLWTLAELLSPPRPAAPAPPPRRVDF